ncbi:oocyte zinc finger protein XlCOF7.1-like [Hyla sarda]|uniref:oocyte zinc finger protein XlCOF7.1-like n=1 Tax=Hyla sarda TaxID=327740 RepID=UPI0024C46F25|nr:oocyte zinc finger protein XlCOF7.1-like [Hyla sarda]
MDKHRNEITKRILHFTLEILHLLTGEDYTRVKKTWGECVAPKSHLHESGGQSRARSPITEPPPLSLIHEEKILELTYRITELLTGEVPIRCQDVAVYFSMEEWEYVEGHKDLYQDIVMMEDHRPLTSQDGVIDRNPPERCPRPLYSQDCPEGNVPDKHQGGDLTNNKVEDEEERMRGHHPCMREVKEEIPGGVTPDGVIDRNPPERCPRPLYSQDCPEGNVPEKHQGKNLIDIKVEDKEEEETDFWADQQYGVIDRNPPERCPRPLYSQDCPEGNVSEKHQGRILTIIKVEDEAEEEWMLSRGDHPCMREVKEEIPGGVVPENPSMSSEGNFMLSLITKDEDMMERSSGEDLLTPNVHPDLSYNNPPDHEEPSPDQPHIVTTRTDHFIDESGRDLFTHRKSQAGEKPYSCSECGKCFTYRSKLILHERIHTGEKPYSCSECGKCFIQKSQLVTHARTHTGVKPYSCGECGKSFTDKSDLVRHERIHTGEKPYSCAECGKCFIQKSTLAAHERIHAGGKLFSCVECGKCFKDKLSLVIHRQSHTGETEYPCSQCGKCFIHKAHLIIHKRSHTGEKPYSCSECGKCFTIRSDLIIHERSHTGEKPYSCLPCGKCFISKSNLIRHERSHAGEKPYSCSECGKCFTRKSSLDRHERNHRGDKPHTCSLCPKRYTERSLLEKHLKTHARTATPDNQSSLQQLHRIINHLYHKDLWNILPEELTIVKKTWGECVAPSSHLHESGGRSRARGPITETPPHSLIHEEKILELIHRITELLTRQVPIRCQDVAVYFSMEEWEYVEGHKDLYQDIMEDHRPLTSQDGVIDRNPPERCPRPLYSQDCPEGNVPENHQGENLTNIKVEVKDEPEEETDFGADQQYGVIDRNPPERCPRHLYSQDCPEGNVPEKHQGGDLTNNKVEDEEERMRGHHPCMRDVKEEIPGGVTPENPSKNSEGNFMLFLNDKGEDEDMMERSSGEDLLTPNVHPDLSCNNPPDHGEPSPDQPHIVTTRTDQKGGKKFQCDECGKEFTKSSNLFTHRRIHTGEKPYSCAECGKCFTHKPYLVTHERIHTGEKPYSCSECGKCFAYKSYLVTHERIHTGEKPYSCSECGKCFTDKSSLVTHERIHKGEKPYSCSECGKCFTYKSSLVTHERNHTGERPYSCSQCDKCFTSSSQLVSHERTHNGEKPYSCSECGKCFINQSGLVRHERSHTGEKPYSCSECGKFFTHKSYLVIHKRTHSGEKPYSCSECGKCFTNKSSLVTHERSHTGAKPYSCSECGKCFTNKQSFVTHERIHSGEKPYSCSECGKCFTNKSSLVKHERIHTRDKPTLCS